VTVLVARLETRITPVNVATSERGVVAIEMLTPPDLFVARLERRLRTTAAEDRLSADLRSRQHLDHAIAELRTFFEGGDAKLDLPLDIGDRPDWDIAVLGGVQAIPRGSVSSYGRIARQIGRAGAARAVGGAVGRNPVGIVIPCHRVIAGDGTIGGYGGAWWGGRDRLLGIKRDMLALEGITLPVRGFAD
jgi:methylated-DNA-[protein]-cysteine S-methyltransferase